MKLAITGHTKGLGAVIAANYHSVGFSKSLGYDIQDPAVRTRIVAEASDCTVFVNNAYAGFAQVDLLYELFEVWQDQPKLIINISSNSGDGIKHKIHPYAVHKAALDKASEQLAYLDKSCKISTVRPGWLDTTRVAAWDGKKITPSHLLQVFDLIIDSWSMKSFTIPTITVLP